MWDRATARMLPITSRVADNAPTMAACCNACRACTTSNVVTLVTAFCFGAAALVGRLAPRLVGRSGRCRPG